MREGRVRPSARAEGNEIAIDSLGCAPRAYAGPLARLAGNEITIDSSGCTPRACVLRGNEVAERSTRVFRGCSRS
jgi:hypothetical protein